MNEQWNVILNAVLIFSHKVPLRETMKASVFECMMTAMGVIHKEGARMSAR